MHSDNIHLFTNKPRVSIICPVLNVEKYLPQMIESVLAQTYQYWEMVVMDGSSKDRTVQIARHYAQRYKNIRVYSEPDDGPWHATDKGLTLARGELAAFVCGQDGFLDRTWLEQAVAQFDRDPEISLVWGLTVTMSEDGKLLGVDPGYAHFAVPQKSVRPWRRIIAKFGQTVKALLLGSWNRKKFLLDKSFSKSSFLRFHAAAGIVKTESWPPQKKDWFVYWLQTALPFPDQSMVISKRVFLECTPRHQPGSKTLGHMTDFFYNFNSRGYLACFLPVRAVFGRQHPGSSGERGSLEMHRESEEYHWKVVKLRERLLKKHEQFSFHDRQGRPIGIRQV